MAQILIMTKYSQYSDNLSVLIISSPVLKTLRTNNQYISSHILKCRIENNFSSLYFIKLKNERYFCPPKAKAPVIFKVKIASTLAFHIQFWVQKSRIPFLNCSPSRGQRKNIKFSRPAAKCCWPLFMQQGTTCVFLSASVRPSYAGLFWCCNNGCSTQSFARVLVC